MSRVRGRLWSLARVRYVIGLVGELVVSAPQPADTLRVLVVAGALAIYRAIFATLVL